MLFEEWVGEDVGSLLMELLEWRVGKWVGGEGGVWRMGKSWGDGGVMELKGEVYWWDEFVFGE